MTDHGTLERIARQLCTDAGRDYDRKGCKRAHWRAKARLVMDAQQAGAQSTYASLKDAWEHLMGGRW